MVCNLGDLNNENGGPMKAANRPCRSSSVCLPSWSGRAVGGSLPWEEMAALRSLRAGDLGASWESLPLEVCILPCQVIQEQDSTPWLILFRIGLNAIVWPEMHCLCSGRGMILGSPVSGAWQGRAQPWTRQCKETHAQIFSPLVGQHSQQEQAVSQILPACGFTDCGPGAVLVLSPTCPFEMVAVWLAKSHFLYLVQVRMHNLITGNWLERGAQGQESTGFLFIRCLSSRSACVWWLAPWWRLTVSSRKQGRKSADNKWGLWLALLCLPSMVPPGHRAGSWGDPSSGLPALGPFFCCPLWATRVTWRLTEWKAQESLWTDLLSGAGSNQVWGLGGGWLALPCMNKLPALLSLSSSSAAEIHLKLQIS